MKRLLALASICLPIYLFAQGFGNFATDQPYLAADRSSGGGIPTSSIYGWYDARQLLTNVSNVSPPSNNDELSNWGAYRGTTSYLIGSHGGALPEPYYLATGNNTNGPAIRNASLYTAQYRQFSRSSTAWCGSSSISQPFTFFIVVKKTADDPNGFDAIMGEELDKTSLNIKVSTAGAIRMYAGTALTGANSAISVGTWYLITAQFNGASSFIKTNGVLYVSGNAGNNSFHGFSIGMYDNFEYLIGNYCDTVFYNRALTTDEINTVETELKTKNNL